MPNDASVVLDDVMTVFRNAKKSKSTKTSPIAVRTPPPKKKKTGLLDLLHSSLRLRDTMLVVSRLMQLENGGDEYGSSSRKRLEMQKLLSLMDWATITKMDASVPTPNAEMEIRAMMRDHSGELFEEDCVREMQLAMREYCKASPDGFLHAVLARAKGPVPIEQMSSDYLSLDGVTRTRELLVLHKDRACLLLLILDMLFEEAKIGWIADNMLEIVKDFLLPALSETTTAIPHYVCYAKLDVEYMVGLYLVICQTACTRNGDLILNANMDTCTRFVKDEEAVNAAEQAATLKKDAFDIIVAYVKKYYTVYHNHDHDGQLRNFRTNYCPNASNILSEFCEAVFGTNKRMKR